MSLYTIFDVYNRLKQERDLTRVILEVNDRDPKLSLDGRLALETEVLFLTNTLADIDVGLHRETEADERGY